MPELPEVETVRRTLKNIVPGKRINGIKILYDKIIDGDTKVFVETVSNQTIRDIDRLGKYLIFILDDTAFISHLRMEGKYNIVPAGQEYNKHEHLGFYLDDGTELRYQDTRKFGRLQLADKDAYRQELPLIKLGPEPWTADPAAVYIKLHRSRLPVKTLLLDQGIMTGIGNIYANEICFRLKIDPRTPGNRLEPTQVAELVEAAKAILDKAIELGGTTIHSFSANGISGLFQNELQVHMQKICPVCGGAISKEAVNGRGTYYCRQCQH